MKRIRLLLILVASSLPLSLFAQQQVTTSSKEVIKANGDDFTLALKHFKNGEAYLYSQGGLSPFGDRKSFKRFYKKYKVVYHELGCVVQGNLDELISYNEAVFELLNFKYGTKWQAMINPDTIGFEEWKKKQGL